MEPLHENVVSFMKHIFILFLKFVGDINLKIVNSFNDMILNKRGDYKGLTIDKLKEEDIIRGKIISWNMHNGYDFYNRDKFIDDLYFLVDEKCEFYLLQEVYDDVLVKLLKETLCVRGLDNCLYENGNLLICNAEKFEPVVFKFKSWEGRTENNCVGCNTNIMGKNLFLLNVHLQSDITLYQQYRQCQELIEFLEKKKGVVIMMGDYNAIPMSPPMKILKKNFHDIRNYERTYPSICPSLTLDYAFISKNYLEEWKKLSEMKIALINNGFSDHCAICVNLRTSADTSSNAI